MVKKRPANAGDAGLMPGLGRYLGEGNGNPLQYSCLGNPMVREGWKAIVHGVTKELDMTFSTKQKVKGDHMGGMPNRTSVCIRRERDTTSVGVCAWRKGRMKA